MHKSKLTLTCQNRIKQHSEFSAVFDRRLKRVSQFFVLYQKDNESNHVRIGVVASKKQVRRAVDRNRIKRLVKESVRLNQFLLAGADLVVVVRHKAVTATNTELYQCLSKLVKQLAN